MFYLAYNILSLFLLLPVVMYHFYRSASRGRKSCFSERFGVIPEEELRKIKGRPVIWLHAVSVGETIAAKPLLQALRSRYPDYAIVLSNTTETGREIASKLTEKDLCLYFPFDFLPAVRNALKTIRPKMVIIMETEIWPNFNREAARLGIPLLLANGRISDRSYNRYLKFSWFFRHPLAFFSALCMQTETDRQRIIDIGAPVGRTIAAGNLKYDIPFHKVLLEEKNHLRDQYAIPHGLSVITAASTHRGEEEAILNCYSQIIQQHKNIFLVLVPRHPERATEVDDLTRQAGLNCRRRTSLNSSSEAFSAGEVLLVDTVGEMMKLYSLSDIAFVGGSLVPTGGHNLLEPASMGIPCMFGPHMTNFREISQMVLEFQAGLQINAADELAAACMQLIDDNAFRQQTGENALTMMQSAGGATERHMRLIAEQL